MDRRTFLRRAAASSITLGVSVLSPFRTHATSSAAYVSTRNLTKSGQQTPSWPWPGELPGPSTTRIVEYSAHLAGTGDTDFVQQPEVCGTEGERRPMEGFILKKAHDSQLIRLRYKVHSQGLGDGKWVYLGGFAGSKGQRRRIEAFKIEVVGTDVYDYDVYYAAYLAGTGWTAWMTNGAECGTTGQKRAIEAIAIFLADKPQ